MKEINNSCLKQLSKMEMAVLDGMVEACLNHQELGEEGKSKEMVNQFGDQALKADLMAEKIILEKLKEYANDNDVILEINGEETGSSILGKKGEKYFGVLDGLDGSENYLNKCSWPYGTMLAITKGENPKYKDFEIAAIGFPEENWVLMARKNSGVFIYDIGKDIYKKIEEFNNDEYDETKILSDNHFSEAKKMLGKMQDFWPRSGSEAAAILAIAVGDQIVDLKYPEINNSWQGMADVTRKGNLEQAGLYLAISELKGVVVDKNNEKIGNNYFKVWGQKEKIPIISAKSSDIAKKILSKLR